MAKKSKKKRPQFSPKKHWFRGGLFLLIALSFLFYPGQSAYINGLVISQEPLSFSKQIDLPETAPYPLNKTGFLAPILTAKAALVLDVESGVILYKKNEKTILSPASTTKIMTALLALETYSLDQVLTVRKVETQGRTMGLVTGEKITAEALLYGTLVHSGNDAAYALAENYPRSGVQGFVQKMNERAKQLHLLDTNFDNPIGFESPNHFTTASDLARLSLFALKNKDFDKIVGTPSLTVHDQSYIYFHQLFNVNELLGKVPGVQGVKTGFTENAGECLVNLVERSGHKILTVVLGSEDRFAESEALLNWVFAHHQWIEFKSE